MPREANTCLGCRVAAAAHRRRLDRVQRLPWPVGWLSAYPLLPLLFRNPSDQACRNFTRVSLLRSGVTSSSAMQGMPRSSSTNPLKHDIEALADEPRIGALEGSGLAMPIARSRAAKRAATSQVRAHARERPPEIKDRGRPTRSNVLGGRYPDLADWRRGFRFWIQQVIEGKGADQQKLARNGCSEDLGHFPGGDRGYHARRHVSPSHQAQEGRQRAPLLEHRGESPGRRRPCGAAAAAVPG